MKIAILGAGSIGCFIGGAWQAAGEKVAFIGRDRIGKAIAADGLTLTESDGWRVHFPPADVDCSTKPAALAKAELIALCVKSNATAEAAKEIGRHARKGATIVTFQNGVSNADVLREALGTKYEVVQGSVPFNVAYLGH
jgi:2-dehydropantoate 2-reductase